MTMEAELPDGTVLEFPDGTAPEVIQTAAKKVLAGQMGLEDRLDRRTGAPVAVRAGVGGAESQKDRLGTLRKYYPDAEPYGDGNFIYTSPTTGRPTLYNEENTRFFGMPIPTLGDIASIGPEVAETAGAAGGAALGMAAVPFTGGASVATVPALTGGGAVAGRELYGLLSRGLFGSEDTRGAGEHVADAALTGGLNAAAGPASDLLMKGVRTATGPVTRYIGGKLRDANMSAALERLNIPATAGQTTGNKVLQLLETGVSNLPGGAGVMQRQADRTIAATDAAADKISQGFANAQPRAVPAGPVLGTEAAGESLKASAKAAGQTFKVTRQKIDDEAVQLIGATRPTGLSKVQTLVNDMRAQLARAPHSQPELERAIREATAMLEDGRVTGGALPFDVVRKIRTRIGSELDRPDLSGYRPGEDAHMARLYGALKEDLYGAAAQAGPDAVKKLQLHDRYVRFMRNDADGRVPPLETLQKIIDTGTDAQAYAYAMQGSKDGAQRLIRLRASMKPEDWDVVAATVYDQLGRALPGRQSATALGEAASDFSVSTFLTNWNRLQQNGSAKAIFSGTRYRDLQQPINDLAKVVSGLKDAEKMANTSGTARSNAVITLFTALGGSAGAYLGGDATTAGGAGLGAAAALTGGGFGAAKLLTNRTFVRWLSTTAKVVMNQPTALRAQIARLYTVAEQEPQLRYEIERYASQLEPQPAP
jgi:hypothetical protein